MVKLSILNIRNKMNRLYILVILIVCMACQSSHQTTLKGVIKNYDGALVRIAVQGSLKRDTLKVNEKGEFQYIPVVPQKGEVYELFVKGYRPGVPLFLSGGDQVNVEITLLPEQVVECVFSGDRERENEYLAALYAIEDSREWYSPEVTTLAFKDFKLRTDEKEKQLQALANRIKDQDVRERLARQAYLCFQVRRVSWYCSGSRENVDDPDFPTFVATINLNDSLTCSEELLEYVIGWHLSQDTSRDWSDYPRKSLELVGRLITDRAMKNYHLTSMFRKYLNQSVALSLQEAYELYNTLCTDENLKREVGEEYKEYVRVNGNLMKGSVAPDFEMMGVTGEKCRLSDFKGKVLLVDVWATWCAPCREELPYMAKLKEYFKKDNRIEIISVAVDNNTNTWKKFLEKEKPAWEQYIVDKKTNDFLETEYRIVGIPHFMLLDQEGRFIAYSFVRPSEPECVELLEKHLN